jgi:hypothetical protein
MNITDTDRINFIEKMVLRKSAGQGVGVDIRQNSLINSQPGMEKKPVQIFTIPSQYQYGKTVREVIDVAMAFACGERNWREEN